MMWGDRIIAKFLTILPVALVGGMLLGSLIKNTWYFLLAIGLLSVVLTLGITYFYDRHLPVMDDDNEHG